MGKKRKAKEPATPDSELHRFQVGCVSVVVKTPNGVTATSAGDGVIHRHVPTNAPGSVRFELADALEALADTIRGTHDDLDGCAEIVVLRRYSGDALRRLTGR